MSPAPAPRTRAAALERPPPTPEGQGDHGFTPRGSAPRPPSLRDAIIRWLNEEL